MKRVANKVNSDNDFKFVLKSSFSTLFAKLLGRFFGILSGIIIARNYGEEVIGTVSLLLASMALIVLFGNFGLHVALLKMIPQNLNKGYFYYSSVIKMSLVLAIALSAVLWVSIDFFGLKLGLDDYSSYNDILPFTVFIFIYLNIGLATLRGLGDVKAYSYFISFPSVIRFVILSVVTVFYYNKGFPILLVFIIPLITDIFLIIYLQWKYFNKFLFNKNTNKDTNFSYKKALSLGFPLMLTEGMFLLISNIDVLMLGAMKGVSHVGIYSVAVTLTVLLTMIYNSIQAFTTSKFSLLHGENNFDGLKGLALKTSKLNFILHLIPSLILVFFGEAILRVFYGDNFSQGYSSLVILTIGIIIRSSCGLVGSLLNMTGNEKIFSMITFFVVLLNILLNYLLIPTMGIEGAAISTAISLASWGLIPVFFVKEKLGFNMIYIPFLRN